MTETNRRTFLQRGSVVAAAFAAAGTSRLLASDAPDQRAVFNVRRFGAKGNSQTNDTAAVQSAIDEAGRDGGCVYFPPGRYVCGTVRLRSHVSIQLESGATLVAAPNRSDFDKYEKLNYNSFSD